MDDPIIHINRHAYHRIGRFFVGHVSRAQAQSWIQAQIHHRERVILATTRRGGQTGYLLVTPECRVAFDRLIIRGQVTLRIRTLMPGGFRGPAYIRYRRDQAYWYHLVTVRFAGQEELHAAPGFFTHGPACGLVAPLVRLALVKGDPLPKTLTCQRCQQAMRQWHSHRSALLARLHKQLRAATRHARS